MNRDRLTVAAKWAGGLFFVAAVLMVVAFAEGGSALDCEGADGCPDLETWGIVFVVSGAVVLVSLAFLAFRAWWSDR